MTEVVDQPSAALRHDAVTGRLLPPPLRPRAPELDLTEAVCTALEASGEPLTPAKIRAHLPGPHRRVGPERLAEVLERQVEAGVLFAYAPYRSQQPRYWSRPLPDHITALVRSALGDGPLTMSQLLRKLPEYATTRAQESLQAQLAAGAVHRHPAVGPRGGERYGLLPPDPRGPLRRELGRLFERLGARLGFSEEQLRAAALEVLQADEWGEAASSNSNEPRYQE